MAAIQLAGCPSLPVRSTFRTVSRTQRSSGRAIITAALDSSAAFAVSQQAVAFAAVVGAEAAFTGLNTKPETPGRPEITSTLVGIGGTVAGAVLLNQAGSVGTVGCGIGFVATAYLLYVYSIRVRDTPYNPNDWPGAKAWPAVMGLLAFFALAANFQGLRDGLGLL